MRWYPLGNGKTTPRLEVFHDAFVLLGSPLHKVLIEKLNGMGDFGPAEFIGKLQAGGVCFSYMERENG